MTSTNPIANPLETEEAIFNKGGNAYQKATASKWEEAMDLDETLPDNAPLDVAMSYLSRYVSDNEEAIDHINGNADADEMWQEQIMATRGGNIGAMDQVRAYVNTEISRFGGSEDGVSEGNQASPDSLNTIKSLQNVLAALDQHEENLKQSRLSHRTAPARAAELDRLTQEALDAANTDSSQEAPDGIEPNANEDITLDGISKSEFDTAVWNTFSQFSQSDPMGMIGHNTYDDLVNLDNSSDTMKAIYHIADIYGQRLASGENPQDLYEYISRDLNKILVSVNGQQDYTLAA